MNNFDSVISGIEEYKMNSPVPGVGPITGLRVADDVVYATRSNGCVMVEWQAVDCGWVQYIKGNIEAIRDSILEGATAVEVVRPNVEANRHGTD